MSEEQRCPFEKVGCEEAEVSYEYNYSYDDH